MWALLPIKNIDQAKQRLASALNPMERRSLFQAMVEDLLTVLRKHESISGITIVSDDYRAKTLADYYKLDFLSESYLNTTNLSNTVQAAVSHISRNGVENIMVVHGDMPLVTNREVSDLIEQHYSSELPTITLAPDRHRTGTNCILYNAKTGFTFHYGTNSFYRHRIQGLNKGSILQIIEHVGTGCDIDYPDDLLYFLKYVDIDNAQTTQNYLLENNIHERLLPSNQEDLQERYKSALQTVNQTGKIYAI